MFKERFEAMYNEFSEEEKSNYTKKMEYIKQFSPKK